MEVGTRECGRRWEPHSAASAYLCAPGGIPKRLPFSGRSISKLNHQNNKHSGRSTIQRERELYFAADICTFDCSRNSESLRKYARTQQSKRRLIATGPEQPKITHACLRIKHPQTCSSRQPPDPGPYIYCTDIQLRGRAGYHQSHYQLMQDTMTVDNGAVGTEASLEANSVPAAEWAKFPGDFEGK